MIKDAMEKNEKATPNGADLEVLKKHFGMCFNSDGSLDLEKLKARLGDQVAISNEGYELKFLGKNYARLLTSLETETVVVPDKKHNAKPENAKSKNVYISGDNLDALKHLLKSKQGQVKCIYIDPPYNTGSDGFVYNDSFGFKVEELASKLSISEDEAQRILDFTKRGSASHSAWLMFMYPRLMLARDLLAKDGVIFISIDDNEQANLKLMCDDIFGEQNFIAQFIWRGGRRNAAKFVSTSHEYMLAYACSLSYCEMKSVDWQEQKKGLDAIYAKVDELMAKYKTNYTKASEDLVEWYKSLSEDNPSKDHDHYKWIDKNGVYFAADISRGGGGGPKWPLTNPETGKPVTVPERGWSYGTFEELESDVKAGLVHFNGDGVPCKKLYLKESEKQLKETVFYKDRRGSSKRLRALMGSDVFEFPKDEEVLRDFLNTFTDEHSIVVDFFSGSGTTFQSVFLANLTDGGCRQVIAVQLPESLDEKLQKSSGVTKQICQKAISFLDAEKLPHTLDYVGYVRIKKAAAKIADENPLLAKTMDLGFKHYTLKAVEGKTLDKIEKFDLNDNALAATDDILKEFGVETVLATWLVHDGYGFGAEPKVIDLDGYKAYWMDKHVYLIEPGLSDKGISALFDKFETEGTFNPGNVVVLGYSFSWTQLEALKNNLLKIAANGTNKHVLLDKRY